MTLFEVLTGRQPYLCSVL